MPRLLVAVPRFHQLMAIATCCALMLLTPPTVTADDDRMQLQEQLRALKTDVLEPSERTRAARTLHRNIDRRLQAANDESSRQWQQIKLPQDWAAFRDVRLAALRKSLGNLPKNPAAPATHVTGRLEGDGFTVERIIFESRPGLWVTANLYRPDLNVTGTPRVPSVKPPCPGILICHSHHNPKTQAELQTMGMTWARLGCLVLVMDQLGHSERRQHPFASAGDYPADFRIGRQDYFFRYDISLQLALIGESLMGWMVNDLMRGVDLLLAQREIDRKRIVLIGAVAGGGDPASVAAALDERITAAVPFNFGGPQPESPFPLPDDAEQSFDYAGGGSWESTRNLRRSAADGFLPWVIVGGIAPRRLIYAHEFSWDQPRDPVWKRLETIYRWHEAEENLAFAHGAGVLRGNPPEATHCNNVGAAHRKMIYPALRRWFDMPGSTEDEHTKTFASEQLLCWTPELRQKLKPKLAHELAGEIADRQIQAVSTQLAALPLDNRRDELRARWTEILGDVEPNKQPAVRLKSSDETSLAHVTVERVVLEVEPDITVPLLLLLPAQKQRVPVVVAICQEGKERFLRERGAAAAEWLSSGFAVCLADVRGTGETAPTGDGRDRTSSATSLSASEWMLGGTLLGARLRDLRTVIGYLRAHDRIAPERIAMWGDSFAPVNPADQPIVVPHGIGKRPGVAEPAGGVLAVLAALFEDDIRAVYARQTVISYRAALKTPAVHLPHDSIVPGVTAAGDLPAILSALPRVAMRFEEPIDGANRSLDDNAIAALQASINRPNASRALVIRSRDDDSHAPAKWMAEQMSDGAH